MNIVRYPPTQNRSLRAWSAAEEYVLKQFEEEDLTAKKIVISHDRFGFLGCYLHPFSPHIVIDRKSQQKSIMKNLARNDLTSAKNRWISALSKLPETTKLGIIGIPKSMDLFRLYLQQIHADLTDDGMVICSFMTRHFTPQILTIAEEYFDDMDQSLAWKKSRLLTLKRKKEVNYSDCTHSIPYTFKSGETEEIKQYFGVFSSGTIDYATQFLLEHLKLTEKDHLVMDLASGNGVIGRAIQLQKPGVDLHLVDDSILAIESSKINLDSLNTHFHWTDTLETFQNTMFDLIVSNPPFHFGHENNIEITLRLFRDTARILKKDGRFICVANRHLNYKNHLEKSFDGVAVVAENEKFVVYESRKSML